MKLGYCSDCQPMFAAYFRLKDVQPWMKPKLVDDVETDWGKQELCISCQAARGVTTSLVTRFLDWLFPTILPW
jgi:hypothetical protein